MSDLGIFMKCELCNKNDAVVHFKQVINGEAKEIMVCQECASVHGIDIGAGGINIKTPEGLGDFLFGNASNAVTADAAGPEPECKACGMKLSDFRKHGRLGCGRCYDYLLDTVFPAIENMHEDIVHVGKVPRKEQGSMAIIELEEELEDAVNSQNYEGAALIRDKINKLKKKVAAKAGKQS